MQTFARIRCAAYGYVWTVVLAVAICVCLGGKHVAGTEGRADASRANGTACVYGAGYWFSHSTSPFGWPTGYSPDATKACGVPWIDVLYGSLYDEVDWTMLALQWIAATLNMARIQQQTGNDTAASVPVAVALAYADAALLVCACRIPEAQLQRAGKDMDALAAFNDGRSSLPLCGAPYASPSDAASLPQVAVLGDVCVLQASPSSPSPAPSSGGAVATSGTGEPSAAASHCSACALARWLHML